MKFTKITPDVSEELQKLITWIESEADYVPDTLKDYSKKYQGYSLKLIEQALKNRKTNFEQLHLNKLKHYE